MKEMMYCPTCGSIGVPKSKMPGSNLFSICLLILFFPAFIAYEIWRRIAPQFICGACAKGGMLPATSPLAKAAMSNQKSTERASASRPPGYTGSKSLVLPDIPKIKPSKFKVIGVDRETEMETTDYITATSAEQAKAKAEIRGIVVTAVEKSE